MIKSNLKNDEVIRSRRLKKSPSARKAKNAPNKSDIIEIKKLMEQAFLNWKELSQITGYSYYTARRWGCDVRMPDHVLDTLRQIAEANEEKIQERQAPYTASRAPDAHKRCEHCGQPIAR